MEDSDLTYRTTKLETAFDVKMVVLSCEAG